MNSAAEMVRSGEVIRRFGGNSGRFRSIPWEGRKRAALWTFSARRRGRGRHIAAALAGGHGGAARYWEEDGEERSARERKKEGEKGRGRRGVSGRLQGGLLVGRASRRWRSAMSRASTQLLPVSGKKTKPLCT
jgi:hypothetical protein